MGHAPLSSDTSPEIEQMQIDAWRRMTSAEKLGLVTSLTQTAIGMTKAGIRDRYPDASPEERRLRLAVILLGRDLALQAFPDVATLD